MHAITRSDFTTQAVVIAIVIVVATGVLTTGLRSQLVEGFSWLETHQPASLVYFTLLYCAWVSCCLSKTPVSIASGYIFGVGNGFCVAAGGMMLACLWSLALVRGPSGRWPEEEDPVTRLVESPDKAAELVGPRREP